MSAELSENPEGFALFSSGMKVQSLMISLYENVKDNLNNVGMNKGTICFL